MQAADSAEDLQAVPRDIFSVLIVDDDEEFRSSLLRALNLMRSASVEAGFSAVSASDAAAALDKLHQVNIDCCVIDYKMPGGDGLTLQHEILRRYPDMAVIVMTGEGSEDVAAKAIKEGAMDYIVKGAVPVEQIESSIVHSVNRARLSKALEMQRKRLVEAERRRVMMQSLGTACHHIAQPLTALRSYIDMLKKNERDPAQQTMLVETFRACESLCEILGKIRSTSIYETEPYLVPNGIHPVDGSDDLIKL